VVSRATEYGSLVLGAVTFWIFQSSARFSFLSSAILACCISIGFTVAVVLWKEASFKPYKLAIGVDFGMILSDLGLINSADDWKPLCAQVASVPDGKDFGQYIFVAITPKLFARPETGKYSTTIYIDELIDVIEAPWERQSRLIRTIPAFFLMMGQDGCRFAFQVEPEWWMSGGGKDHAHPAARDLFMEPSGHIILGTIPYGYFPNHVWRWEEPLGLFNRWDRAHRKWNKRLTALGWSVDRDYPNQVRNRYLDVGQWHVNE
jgi:hypothetical protein